MKDNFENIEKLFQDSFEGFEADVDPNVWTNISNQIGQAPVQDPTSISSSAGSASSGVGASLGIGKIAMIVGAAAILATGSYFIFSEDKEAIKTQEDTVVQDEVKVIHQEAVEIPEIQAVEVQVEQDKQTSRPAPSISDTKNAEKPTSVSHKIQPSTNNAQVIAKESQPVQKENNESDKVVAKKATTPIVETKKALEGSPEKDIEEKDIYEASIYASIKAGKQPLEVHFENIGTYSNDLTWTFKDGDLSNRSSVSHTFEKSGEYWVVLEIKDVNGRMSKDSTKITVEGRAFINANNTFSPNNDGINDAFMVECEYVNSFNCKIFDRNNRMIYEWNNIYGHWDGTDMSGSSVVPGTYFYLITAQDEDGNDLKPVKGFVTLFR